MSFTMTLSTDSDVLTSSETWDSATLPFWALTSASAAAGRSFKLGMTSPRAVVAAKAATMEKQSGLDNFIVLRERESDKIRSKINWVAKKDDRSKFGDSYVIAEHFILGAVNEGN